MLPAHRTRNPHRRNSSHSDTQLAQLVRQTLRGTSITEIMIAMSWYEESQGIRKHRLSRASFAVKSGRTEDWLLESPW